MLELHKALEHLRPKEYADVPLTELSTYLPSLFSHAEFIANSVPPPPNGTPFESAERARKDDSPAVCAADLIVSNVRRPEAVTKEQKDLHKAWGKPLKLGAKEAQTGISVYKMAGNDRHGAWFARTSVHEGLGFGKWKRAMMREFPESLEVEGGPGVGSIRGIGGDRRLEDVVVEGVGRMEVYQLSAQFPGPTAAREFITLLLTSENCLSEASKVNNVIPRHYMVVSIPVDHSEAPPRNGFVRGEYESVEMIREIPLSSKDSASADEDETNPVEWIMITRSDPGGGIPRFMVERGTPGSIVQDAGKFLDWACPKDDFPPREEDEQIAQESAKRSMDTEKRYSIANSNGVLAGVGTSIADRPGSSSFRRPSHRTTNEEKGRAGVVQKIGDTFDPYVPDALNPLHRKDSSSSATSSVDSFASAEQFTNAPIDIDIDITIPTSSTSEQSLTLPQDDGAANQSRELQKIEQKRQQLNNRLEVARQKETDVTSKTERELSKASEKHVRERKRQEDKYAKEVQKLEARRERETRKLLARQQKEADKNNLSRLQRERDEWKEKAELADQENKVLSEQVGDLQRENTALAARMGKVEGGKEMLKGVREEMLIARKRAASRASVDSSKSKGGGTRKRSE
ncbi:hypothetical protein P280DRAFT_112097 [Massarina eburnea CBS 473.64]|uniref:DUF3074 domain-containing protein n=1 Tax=Massarina eburnea CBS 473.64 TaxID=1395130 RepID=A0A6A6RQ34_9PLEO|nr:hypothetical protein P280DRAFT_112097 [Massarina eburnea CBS 473.64]